MTTILRLDTSAQRERSLTRALGDDFEQHWRRQRPADTWLYRDLARVPPLPVTGDWIAAAFTPEEHRSAGQAALLAPSDRMIDELVRADLILLTVPMYNYGPPATLKAWIDNVVRKGRTFSFDLGRGDWPLAPVLGGKELVVLTASGEFGFDPGGTRERMDHLVPHLDTVRHYLGAGHMHVVRIEYQEFGDDRHRASLEAARGETLRLAERLATARIQATEVPAVPAQ